MNLRKMMATILACAAPLLLASCGGGDSERVTGASSGPRYPAVSGSWEGHWEGSGIETDAFLDLSQDRNQVRGTLTVGRVVNRVSGTVSEFGVLTFQGQPPGSGCTTYSTKSPHLVLEERNTTLDGPVERSEPNLGGPCGGLSFLTEGRMELRKVG